ncbi:hypothetical protein [Metabacillus endolithicus]|uniref:Uncharacterized protein n=1 Tax=Metabacillus endolithicus TaxID=1535204 RepID=A0ABW5BU22_9BACI|nr:hypothetical protein [Metabacillus endolithicus]UPG63667.1 hypothetical protein MVE64_00315 [Metabacillus endolithicus]
MDNKILIERLRGIPELKLNKHVSSEKLNGECITRNPNSRRKNVIGDINPTGNSFLLYKNGEWHPNKKLGILTLEEAIIWIEKDIENISKK